MNILGRCLDKSSTKANKNAKHDSEVLNEMKNVKQ